MKTLATLISLPLLFFTFINCGGAQTANSDKTFEQNPPFKIADAYYQDWVAGVKEGGSGTNVHFVFSQMEPNVEIKKIYFRNNILEAKPSEKQPNQYIGYLRNNAQRDIVMDKDPIKEAQNSLSKTFPFPLENNEAVIEYVDGGTKNFYKISTLTKKEMIPYPQANPNNHE